MDRFLLKHKIAEIKKLPSCPDLLPQVIQLSRLSNASMRDYEKIIRRDPSLVAQIFKIVNSPFYGMSHQISNLRVALTILGLTEVYRIVLNTSFYKSLQNSFDGLSYDFRIFWKHCEMVANAAQFFAEKFHRRQIGEAYAAGLLHDIGKLVMEQYFPDEWGEVLLEFTRNEGDFLDIETDVFGFNHAEVGSLLLEQWNIPDEIVIPVQFHHNPFGAIRNGELTNIVYFADKTAAALTEDFRDDVTHEGLDKDKLWYEMIARYPHFNILDSERMLASLQEILNRSIPE